MNKWSMGLSAILLFSFSDGWAFFNSNSLFGTDLQNTRSFKLSPINRYNVNKLKVKWVHLTQADSGTNNTVPASVSSTPAVEGAYIYFNDLSGHITKLNRFTGRVIWKKNYVNQLSRPGFSVTGSRNTPYIKGNLVIVGSNLGLLDRYCGPNEQAKPNVCTKGDGAIVLALNKNNGNVVWRKKVDSHPAAKITGSISGHGNMIYVPVASWEEDWARAYPNIYQTPIDPNSRYPCCSFRGSLVAMDIRNQKVKWKTYTVSGNGKDIGSKKLRNLFKPIGFTGTSTYGHHPTLDLKRRLIYIATAQNQTSPKVSEDCEKARRDRGNPRANIKGLPPGVTCNNLNKKLKNYHNAIIALDMNSGKVRWFYQTRQYDSWNHACGAPGFYGWGTIVPLVFPLPKINNENCNQDPIGPDLGFGQQPILVKAGIHNPRDIVIAGNKDGRLFGINPNNGRLLWETNVDPGGIYGGLQFGIATDGKNVYFGTTNSRNVNREHNYAFVSDVDFLNFNNLQFLRVGPFVKKDGATPVPYPAPSLSTLPFPGPVAIFGSLAAGYPASFNNYFPPSGPGVSGPDFLFKGPYSGPVKLWRIINPPSDVRADGKTVISKRGGLYTTNGMVTAVDVRNGQIRWQRPAYDGIRGKLGAGQAFGTLTVGNGLVFIGYADGKGTMVALDARNGRLLFKHHARIVSGSQKIRAGGIESGPYVIGRWVYWGVGNESGAIFPDKNNVFSNGGNRLYAFQLPNLFQRLFSNR